MDPDPAPLSTPWIAARAAALEARVREHRRALHRHPELGFAEHRTAAYVEHVLDGLGVPHRRLVGTGIVAVLRGTGPRAVGVRADMDALPVEEAPGREGYRSEVPGISHACGHDAHVAVALGLAELLAGAGPLPGSVALYFQPAEEGPGGAAPMLAAGALVDPPVEAVLALHTSARHRSGDIAVRSGPSTGSGDRFVITVRGRGGHAAHPDTAIDPVPVAGALVTAVQHLLDREVDPVHPRVFTFGMVHGGTRYNVIAPEVVLEGTLRTVHAEDRDRLVHRVTEVATGIAALHRATAEVAHLESYGVGVNDDRLAALVAAAGTAVLGADRVVAEPYPSLGGEDFYDLGRDGVPCMMFLLGIADAARGITAPNHSADFDVDESALPAGVAVFAESLRRLLTPVDDATDNDRLVEQGELALGDQDLLAGRPVRTDRKARLSGDLEALRDDRR